VIAHLSYVMCDGCANPAEVSDDAQEARAVAKRQGFVRTDDGRDLCPNCVNSEPKEEGQ
jgi:hypothetical protein